MQSVAFVVLALVAVAAAAPVEQVVADSEVKPVVPALTSVQQEVASVKPESSQKVVEKQEDKVSVPVTRSGYSQASASAYVARSPPVASDVDQIVSYEFDQQPEGNYRLRFQTEKGIYREEIGEIKEVYDEKNVAHKVLTVRGVYNYLKEDNSYGQITYSADELGYKAAGEAIPVAPQ